LNFSGGLAFEVSEIYLSFRFNQLICFIIITIQKHLLPLAVITLLTPSLDFIIILHKSHLLSLFAYSSFCL
jgi:hypothetical protein